MGTLDAFRTDAALWALAHQDRPTDPVPVRLAGSLARIEATDIVSAVIFTADTVLQELVADPGSYLIGGPSDGRDAR